MGQTQNKLYSSPKSSAKDWIDQKCDHFHAVTFTKNSIRAGDNVTLYGHEHIRGQFYICVEIRKMQKDGWMSIGISDAVNAISNEQSLIKTNWVIYRSSGAVIANLNFIKSSCNPAKVGDIVEVSGDISTGIVEWSLNKSLLYVHKLQNFQNKQINWVLLLHLSKATQLKLVNSLINFELIFVHLALSLFSWDDDLLREIDAISQKYPKMGPQEVR